MPQQQAIPTTPTPAMNRKQRRALKARPNGAMSPGNAGARDWKLKLAHRQAQDLLRKGDYAKLVEAAQSALELYPQEAELWLLLGRGYERLDALTPAYKCYKKAVELAPEEPRGWLALGESLRAANRFEASEIALKRHLELMPDSAPGCYAMARTCLRLGKMEEGLEFSERHIELEPDASIAYFVKGVLLKTASRLEEAREAFNEAHRLDPKSVKPLQELSDITEGEDLEVLLEKLEAFPVERVGMARQKADILFSIARVHRARKDHDRAFEHYAQANAVVAEQYPFNKQEWVDRVEGLMEAFNADLFKSFRGKGLEDQWPVFIVGTPRCGSSLTEQIISSHSKVHGAGEHTAMLELMARLEANSGEGVAYPHDIAKFPPESLEILAQHYKDTVTRDAPEGYERVTDKMLSNFLNLGIIALMYPNANVVHCQRDPVDTCLSCFFQQFNDSERLSFTLDLEAMGFFYRQYHRLMEHWRSVLPMQIYEQKYEDLLADQEGQTRKLLDYIGLDWEDACLDFHKSDRAVITASVVQARKPLFKTASGRWRRYEKHLGPLLDALGDLVPAD